MNTNYVGLIQAIEAQFIVNDGEFHLGHNAGLSVALATIRAHAEKPEVVDDAEVHGGRHCCRAAAKAALKRFVEG